MENINIKLESNNPVFCSQLISNLVDVISKSKNNYEDQIAQETKEIKFIKEKCASSDPNISKTACEGILKLIHNGVLEVSPNLINQFVSVTTHATKTPGVIHLLYMLMLGESEKYSENSYNLVSPAHPFLQVLVQNPTEWNEIFDYIKCYYNKDKRKHSGFDLFEPLYFYIFFERSISQLFKQQLWTFLIHNQRNHPQLHNLLYKQLKWFQLESKESVSEVVPLVLEILNYESNKSSVDFERIDVLLLYLTSLLHELILHKLNPSETTFYILKIVDELYRDRDLSSVNCVLLILSNCIIISSVTYVSDLIELCYRLGKMNINNFVLHAVKAAVLPWLIYPSFLSESVTKQAHLIFGKAQQKWSTLQHTNQMQSSQFYCLLKNSATFMNFAANFCTLTETWKSEDDVLNYINKLQLAPLYFVKHAFTFLTAIFITDFTETDISLKALKLLLDCIDKYKHTTNNLLTIILYKLSVTTDPKLHFELLKSLPKLAAHKENVQLISSTMQALSNGPRKLSTFTTVLYYDLWKVDKKFYTYLEKMLVADIPGDGNLYWESQVTRAKIMKEICHKQPEVYGKEMVAYLSKILNDCNREDGAIPCALAFEGITVLCKSGVIDIATTWDALAPRFKKDTRVIVIKSFCALLTTVSSFTYTDGPEYCKLIGEVLAQLWEYITTSSYVEVIDAALKALSCFSLEQISEYFPATYRDEPQTADVLINLVPGDYWIKLMQNGNYDAIHAFGDFLITLLSLEIATYKRSTYEVTQNQKEPVNYNYLPKHSIVRAIGNYLKTQVQNWNGMHKLVYLECLRIFSHEYTKPLPPLQWNFLQELIHESETRSSCITIISHQVMLSGTARRLMENLLTALSEVHTNDDDILTIFKNFKYVCNSIQPMVIRPFVNKTMGWCLHSENTENLDTVLHHTKQTLTDPEINDANKSVLAEIILQYIKQGGLGKLLPCVNALPAKYVSTLSEPEKYTNITSADFKTCVEVRCTIAKSAKTQPLEWLNEVLYFPNCVQLGKEFVLEEITSVFAEHRTHTHNVFWTLDLLWRIQAELTDAEECNERVVFLFDVFILAVLIFSGFNTFCDCTKSNRLHFAQGIKLLLKDENWVDRAAQILEWLHHAVNLKFVPVEYRQTFLESLVALRNEEYFKKNFNWLKYLNNEVSTKGFLE